MRHLPSLNGLRAFEAAARHRSFAAAAAELNVSAAAVSRLVRLLEERLGLKLFERRPNGLVLTAQGRAFQPGLTSAFDAIAGLAEQIRGMRDGVVLTVGVGPTFAIRWLIPRLGDFQRKHPEIEVRLTTGGAAVPLQDDWTCGIRLGDGDWPGYAAEALFSAEMSPVCTPALAERLRRPVDLKRMTLLDVAHAPEDWPQWLEAAGLSWAVPTGAPRFDTYAMALQAALDGVGVAMGLRPYVMDDLAARRLVAPFRRTVRKGRAWYLVHRPRRAEEPALAAFRTWMREVARPR
jgi:DNA-binding transcriptional LysR family regulator